MEQHNKIINDVAKKILAPAGAILAAVFCMKTVEKFTILCYNISSRYYEVERDV